MQIHDKIQYKSNWGGIKVGYVEGIDGNHVEVAYVITDAEGCYSMEYESIHVDSVIEINARLAQR